MEIIVGFYVGLGLVFGCGISSSIIRTRKMRKEYNAILEH